MSIARRPRRRGRRRTTRVPSGRAVVAPSALVKHNHHTRKTGTFQAFCQAGIGAARRREIPAIGVGCGLPVRTKEPSITTVSNSAARGSVRKPTEEHTSEDLVRTYLREVGRYPLLRADQEVSLAKSIEEGNKARTRLEGNGRPLAASTRAKLEAAVNEGERARRTFIEANLRLVVSIARRYQGYGLPLLDLIQEGNLGLLRAVEKYEWRRGFKFSTYATWWIRQGITRGLADRSRTIRLPVHIAEIVIRLRRIEAELSADLGREPTDSEVAKALGIDETQLEAHRMTAMDTVSLSAPLGEDGGAELHDFLEDEACDKPLEEAVKSRAADELRDLLGTLSTREQRILELRFGLTDGRERTLEQVGVEFKLTRERIRQIEAKAIAKLRHPSLHGDIEAFRD